MLNGQIIKYIKINCYNYQMENDIQLNDTNLINYDKLIK